MFRLNRQYNQKTVRYRYGTTLCKTQKEQQPDRINKERCRRLKKLGLMADSGKAVLPNMSDGGKAILLNISDSDFVINQDILTLLQSYETLWKTF